MMSRDPSWSAQFSEGEQAEGLVAYMLEAAGWSVERATGNHPAWDLRATSPDGDVVTIECKAQPRAASDRYGSVLVETQVLGRLAGIRTSEADTWVFVIGKNADPFQVTEIIWLPTSHLRELVRRVVQRYGLTPAPSGSHPGMGARVYLDELAGEVDMPKALREGKRRQR